MLTLLLLQCNPLDEPSAPKACFAATQMPSKSTLHGSSRGLQFVWSEDDGFCAAARKLPVGRPTLHSMWLQCSCGDLSSCTVSAACGRKLFVPLLENPVHVSSEISTCMQDWSHRTGTSHNGHIRWLRWPQQGAASGDLLHLAAPQAVRCTASSD